MVDFFMEMALKDEYFIEGKNLYPNVDFYSGIIYRALGIPTSMFTVMFAIKVGQNRRLGCALARDDHGPERPHQQTATTI